MVQKASSIYTSLASDAPVRTTEQVLLLNISWPEGFGWCDNVFCLPSGRQSHSQPGHQAGQQGDWSQGKLLRELRTHTWKITVHTTSLQTVCPDVSHFASDMLFKGLCLKLWKKLFRLGPDRYISLLELLSVIDVSLIYRYRCLYSVTWVDIKTALQGRTKILDLWLWSSSSRRWAFFKLLIDNRLE